MDFGLIVVAVFLLVFGGAFLAIWVYFARAMRNPRADLETLKRHRLIAFAIWAALFLLVFMFG